MLKTPHHLGFMDLLFEVFPDVRVVQTHRDPLQTIPSLASLIHAIRSLGSDAADPRVAGSQWSGRMSRALHRCMEVRESHEDRFIDVFFENAMRDPLAEIRRIYEFAGMELTPEAEAKMRQWTVDNARDKRVGHSYTLEAVRPHRRGNPKGLRGLPRAFHLASEFRRHRLAELGGARAAALVGGERAALGVGARDRRFQAPRGLPRSPGTRASAHPRAGSPSD